jgi:hypothetical protein
VMTYVLTYTRSGHFDGMAHPMRSKRAVATDKWGFAVFDSREAAMAAFDAVVTRNKDTVAALARDASARTGKPLDRHLEELAALYPPPTDPKLQRLVDVEGVAAWVR